VIDPHWQLQDLDPVTWRNLGPYFEPENYIRTAQPGERGLFVLHEEGKPLRVFDTEKGERADLDLSGIDDPHTLAHSLYESGEWERVHVINKTHLAHVAQAAQQIKNRELTLDQYYRLVYQLIWQSPTGYVSVPPHRGEWNGLKYGDLQEYVARLPDPCSVALGVIEDGKIFIGLILGVRGGMIRTVTSFEALELDTLLELSAESFERLWAALGERFDPPAAALLCDRVTFEGLVKAENKRSYLAAVGHAQPYFYRVELN
jgi:hypothetical protein